MLTSLLAFVALIGLLYLYFIVIRFLYRKHIWGAFGLYAAYLSKGILCLTIGVIVFTLGAVFAILSDTRNILPYKYSVPIAVVAGIILFKILYQLGLNVKYGKVGVAVRAIYGILDGCVLGKILTDAFPDPSSSFVRTVSVYAFCILSFFLLTAYGLPINEIGSKEDGKNTEEDDI